MDKNELKIEALRQRIAELTVGYEDRIADLRVELTIVSQQLQEAADVEVAQSTAAGDDQ